MKTVTTLIGALVIALGSAGAAAAAQPAGMRGTVRVAGSGMPLEGAVVRLTLAGFDRPVERVTDKQGRFDFAWVLPGTYTVAVKRQGFRTVELPVEGRSGDRLVLTVPLVQSE